MKSTDDTMKALYAELGSCPRCYGPRDHDPTQCDDNRAGAGRARSAAGPSPTECEVCGCQPCRCGETCPTCDNEADYSAPADEQVPCAKCQEEHERANWPRDWDAVAKARKEERE